MFFPSPLFLLLSLSCLFRWSGNPVQHGAGALQAAASSAELHSRGFGRGWSRPRLAGHGARVQEDSGRPIPESYQCHNHVRIHDVLSVNINYLRLRSELS